MRSPLYAIHRDSLHLAYARTLSPGTGTAVPVFLLSNGLGYRLASSFGCVSIWYTLTSRGVFVSAKNGYVHKYIDRVRRTVPPTPVKTIVQAIAAIIGCNADPGTETILAAYLPGSIVGPTRTFRTEQQEVVIWTLAKGWNRGIPPPPPI